MSIPATGTTFREGGFASVDNRLYSRGPLAAALIRDNRGSATNISPYTAGTPPVANWSPFALDGQLRDDLFAYHLVEGQWQPNYETNEGWWLVGAFDDKGGPDRKAEIKHDDAMILQSTFPFDTDLTGEGITVQFTAVEVFKPMLMRLRLNLPLTDVDGNTLVEPIGSESVILSKPIDADSIDRQLMLVFMRKRPGGYIIHVEVYPLCKLTDIGAVKRSKTDPDAASLSYTVLPDPYYVDLDPADPLSGELVPALYSHYIGGDAWAAMEQAGS